MADTSARDRAKAASEMRGGPIHTIGAEVSANLDKAIKELEARGIPALRAALLMVKRESMRLTPVRFGFLRRSCYTDVFDHDEQKVGIIWYEAAYAPAVHEVDATHKEPTQWKFLETALVTKGSEILEVLRRYLAVDSKEKDPGSSTEE